MTKIEMRFDEFNDKMYTVMSRLEKQRDIYANNVAPATDNKFNSKNA